MASILSELTGVVVGAQTFRRENDNPTTGKKAGVWRQVLIADPTKFGREMPEAVWVEHQAVYDTLISFGFGATVTLRCEVSAGKDRGGYATLTFRAVELVRQDTPKPAPSANGARQPAGAA